MTLDPFRPRRPALPGMAGVLALAILGGCQANETHRTLPVQSVDARGTAWHGPRPRLAIGDVQNRSPYGQGIFSDGEDRLGTQARQILTTHLTQSNRFLLLDRANLAALEREAAFSGEAQSVQGAQFVLTGAVTEFGRRETGSEALGGVIGKSRKQTAYAKVSLTLVDVATSAAVYSVQGAGEFDLEASQLLGFGSKAGYDATLTDKVLNLAMLDAVNQLVAGLERDEWGAAR